MKSMKDLMSLFEMDSDKKDNSKECKTCKKDPCKCDTELDEALMREYKHYVQEALPNTPQGQQVGAQGQASGQQPAQAGTAQAGAQTQAQTPAQPQQPTQGQSPQQPPGNPKPQVPQPQQPVQPGALPDPQGEKPEQTPGATQTPAAPDPNALKQTTDQLTKILSNPQDPKNTEIRDLLKNAGIMK